MNEEKGWKERRRRRAEDGRVRRMEREIKERSLHQEIEGNPCLSSGHPPGTQ